MARRPGAVCWSRARGVLLVGVVAAVFIGYTPEPGHPSALAGRRRSGAQSARALGHLLVSRHRHAAAITGTATRSSGRTSCFFRCIPLLMRAGGVVTGGHPLLAGLVISLAAFLLGAVLFLAVDRRSAGAGHRDRRRVAAQRVSAPRCFSARPTPSRCICSSSSPPATTRSAACSRARRSPACWAGWSGPTACCCRSRSRGSRSSTDRGSTRHL